MVDTSGLSDVQSESGVIGSLILHPDFAAISDNLLPNYFSSKENACYYWGIRQLIDSGVNNIDAFNLSKVLQGHEGVQHELDKYNLPNVKDMIDLYSEAARNTVEEYKFFMNNVITLAFKRDLAKKLDLMQKDCLANKTDLEALSNEVYGTLDNLTQQYVVQDELQTLGDQIDGIWDEIVSRRTSNGLFGLPSKYEAFSEYFTYEPGELVIVQARYKEGKSVLLMNEAVHKLKCGESVLVIDSEMPDRLYVERLLSHLSGIEMKRIKGGTMSQEEEAEVAKWRKWLKEQPLIHKYDPNMTLSKLYSICKILKRKMNLGFVVYDYLKSNEKDTGMNYNILGQMCDFLKNKVAGELDLPVLAACQLNRQHEVADSDKINRYLSVGVKWGYKSQEQIAKDGMQCGNAFAKIYVNRLGPQMQEDDEDEYIDFTFSGDNMTIVEAVQHERQGGFN